MALNLNASPYYDDYSSSKDYHRVLFKPGVAVQARELTQLQTVLQNQIEKGFGFVFLIPDDVGSVCFHRVHHT